MALSESDRFAGTRAWIKKMFVEANETAIFNLDELKAAFDAVDGWADANQASYVASLPEPFKSGSNASQKALLLSYVAMKRGGII